MAMAERSFLSLFRSQLLLEAFARAAGFVQDTSQIDFSFLRTVLIKHSAHSQKSPWLPTFVVRPIWISWMRWNDYGALSLPPPLPTQTSMLWSASLLVTVFDVQLLPVRGYCPACLKVSRATLILPVWGLWQGLSPRWIVESFESQEQPQHSCTAMMLVTMPSTRLH